MIILIGGTSHTGKSTLAQQLAARLGGESRSTDGLARHPGRPWPAPLIAMRPHLTEHYGTLSHEERMASVLDHYRSMAPRIEEVLRRHREDAPARPLVLEGSALLPETAAALASPDVRALWLTADDELLRGRIERESGYADAGPDSRPLIEAFLERACRFNRFVVAELERRRLPGLGVEAGLSPETLAELALDRFRPR